MDISPVKEAYNELRSVDAKREDIIKIARIIGRSARQAIITIHSGKLREAENIIAELKQLVKNAVKKIGPHSTMFYGILRTPTQEYVEAAVFLSIAKKDDRIPSYKELEVDPSTYLLGVADSVGEARRLTLSLLKSWNIEEAERVFSIMECLVNVLSLWDLPDAVSYTHLTLPTTERV